MKGVSKFFDINMVLMAVFSSLESVKHEKGTELVYDIDPTVPKELKGDPEALTRLLTHILTFVFKNTEEKEVVLYISAPEDFMFEEPVSFKVKTGLDKQRVANFVKIGLVNNLELLGGNIVFDEKHPSDIRIDIPIRLNELGYRRYYRLPDMAMLGKKVLLLCKSPNVANSIKKMFKYFLYEVDAGTAEFKKSGSDLSQYDILVIGQGLVSERLEALISKTQKEIDLKYVIIQDSDYNDREEKQLKVAYLVKPVMQESILELITLLYENEMVYKDVRTLPPKITVNMENYINDAVSPEDRQELYDDANGNIKYMFKQNGRLAEKSPEVNKLVLDPKIGKRNCKAYGEKYEDEIKSFMEAFDKSDVYFKQMVEQQSTWKIKVFCIDLEKRSKLIGALGMLKLAEEMSLLFVYDKLEDLPSFTVKYHGELKKLMMAIHKYLKNV